jgi:hypothetical protein
MDRASDPFDVTGPSNGVEPPIHTGFPSGPSQSDTDTQPDWYSQINMSDFDDVDTLNLLEGFELQQFLQDTTMLWDRDVPT